MRFGGMALGCLVWAPLAAQAGARVYPAPSGLEASPLYKVRVNGQASFTYAVTVNPTWEYRNIAAPAAMTAFDMDTPVEVQIEVPLTVSVATVHPDSRGVKARVQPGLVSFVIPKADNFVVFFNGTRNEPLFVFANPAETQTASRSEAGVIYYGPGMHEAGLIELKSNQTLYLAGGAFVKGRVKADNAENVRIRGRGILYGGEIAKESAQGDKFIMFRRCRNVLVEGVTALDSFGWNLMLAGCRNVVVENFKAIGWRMNSDGIDPVSTEDLVIRNCFLKTQDDGITIKGSSHWGPNVRNIEISRCTMWQNWMRSFVLGGELTVARTENIRIRDSDIIYSGINPKSAGNRDAALSVWNVDDAVAGDIVFEDIRVEEAVRLARIALFKNKHSRAKEWGRIRGVVFRNITVQGGPAAIEISGHSPEHLSEDIVFENLRIRGRVVKSAAEVDSYSEDPYSRGIRFR